MEEVRPIPGPTQLDAGPHSPTPAARPSVSDLIRWVEAMPDSMGFIQQRIADGEIHQVLEGLITCDARYGDRRHCSHAWPSECESENGYGGYYYCGVGRCGGYRISAAGKSEFVPGAPRYTETADSRFIAVARLKAAIAEATEGPT